MDIDTQMSSFYAEGLVVRVITDRIRSRSLSASSSASRDDSHPAMGEQGLVAGGLGTLELFARVSTAGRAVFGFSGGRAVIFWFDVLVRSLVGFRLRACDGTVLGLCTGTMCEGWKGSAG